MHHRHLVAFLTGCETTKSSTDSKRLIDPSRLHASWVSRPRGAEALDDVIESDSLLKLVHPNHVAGHVERRMSRHVARGALNEVSPTRNDGAPASFSLLTRDRKRNKFNSINESENGTLVFFFGQKLSFVVGGWERIRSGGDQWRRDTLDRRLNEQSGGQRERCGRGVNFLPFLISN